MRNRLLWLVALAVALVLGPDLAAQDSSTFQVDGDPMDWGGGHRFDERQDVVPDTNRAVDLRSYSFGGGGRVFYWDPVTGDADTLFTFLFKFLAPPFQGAEETTVEIFFDMSQSDAYGVAQGPWLDFRPDYVIGVTGRDGALTKEFYWRWTGSAWDKKEGADIPEVEIALGVEDRGDGGWLEGAWDWKLLDIPDTDVPHYDLKGDYNSDKAVRVSRGEYRDYLPNGDYALRNEVILPTAVESDSWGAIKSQ